MLNSLIHILMGLSPGAQMISPKVQIQISTEAQGPCELYKPTLHRVSCILYLPKSQVRVKHYFIDAVRRTVSIFYPRNNFARITCVQNKHKQIV